MEKTLEVTLEQHPANVDPKISFWQKIQPFFQKWGVWILIGLMLILCFTLMDWRGVIDSIWAGWSKAEKKRGEQIERTNFWIAGVIAGVVFVFGILFLIMLGIGNLYYRFFHQRVFRDNELSYTILYLLVLILVWNLLTDNLAKIPFYQSGNKAQDHKLNELFASTGAAFFILFLVVYGFIKDFRKHHKQQALLLQQKTQAELDALKAQVNPHFLFNTLNNLYGTALAEDSPRTAESIHQLSGIVRYVMEEANSTRTDVQRELRFIDDYVELQRMRIPRLDNIRILVETFWDEQPAEVMPLLLNPLIENAFKYGISIQHPCFVEIRLRIEAGLLTFSTRNSLVPRTQLERSTGLGLKNVQKRLALAYPGRHEFSVSETEGVFTVTLKIDLNKN